MPQVAQRIVVIEEHQPTSKWPGISELLRQAAPDSDIIKVVVPPLGPEAAKDATGRKKTQRQLMALLDQLREPVAGLDERKEDTLGKALPPNDSASKPRNFLVPGNIDQLPVNLLSARKTRLEGFKGLQRADALVIPAELRVGEWQKLDDFGGVHLLRLLRFEPDAQRLLLQPVIVVGSFSLELILRKNPEHSILIAPGSHYLQTPFDLAELALQLQAGRSPIQINLGQDSNATAPENELTAIAAAQRKQFMPWLTSRNHENLLDKHSFLNEIGPCKLVLQAGLQHEHPTLRNLAQKYFDLACCSPEIRRWLVLRQEDAPWLINATDLGNTSMPRFAQPARLWLIDDCCDMGWFETVQALLKNLALEGQIPVLHPAKSKGDADKLFKSTFGQLASYLKTWAKWDAAQANGQRKDPETASPFPEELRQAESAIDFAYSLRGCLLDLRLGGLQENSAPGIEQSEGEEFLSQLRACEYSSHLPVIVFTASEQAKTAETVRQIGADGFWIKTVNDPVDLGAEWLSDKEAEAYKLLAKLSERHFVPRILQSQSHIYDVSWQKATQLKRDVDATAVIDPYLELQTALKELRELYSQRKDSRHRPAKLRRLVMTLGIVLDWRIHGIGGLVPELQSITKVIPKDNPKQNVKTVTASGPKYVYYCLYTYDNPLELHCVASRLLIAVRNLCENDYWNTLSSEAKNSIANISNRIVTLLEKWQYRISLKEATKDLEHNPKNLLMALEGLAAYLYPSDQYTNDHCYAILNILRLATTINPLVWSIIQPDDKSSPLKYRYWFWLRELAFYELRNAVAHNRAGDLGAQSERSAVIPLAECEEYLLHTLHTLVDIDVNAIKCDTVISNHQ